MEFLSLTFRICICEKGKSKDDFLKMFAIEDDEKMSPLEIRDDLLK